MYDKCSDCEYKDVENLRLENQGLKKQLEEERKKVSEYSYKLSNFRCEETYENQQKEFIEYLENEIERYRKTLSERPTNDLEYNNYKVTDVALEQIKIVLSKYKEIIGGKE